MSAHSAAVAGTPAARPLPLSAAHPPQPAQANRQSHPSGSQRRGTVPWLGQQTRRRCRCRCRCSPLAWRAARGTARRAHAVEGTACWGGASFLLRQSMLVPTKKKGESEAMVQTCPSRPDKKRRAARYCGGGALPACLASQRSAAPRLTHPPPARAQCEGALYNMEAYSRSLLTLSFYTLYCDYLSAISGCPLSTHGPCRPPRAAHC